MKGKADKVSAAIQAEGTASSKTIKVMILNAVTQAKEDERKNQKAKNTKRANENGEQKSKKLEEDPKRWHQDKENYGKEDKTLPTLSHQKWSRRQKQCYTSRKLKKEYKFYQKM